MKKILFIILILSITIINIKIPIAVTEEEIKAIFISYIELNKYIDKENNEISKENINKMINNIKKLNLNTIILQVRSNQDSIYKSKIFPTSIYVSKEEGLYTFDILKYFITKAKSNNIKILVWINPYRVRTTNKKESITPKSPAYKYLDTDTVYINNGIYLNPSKEEVTNLIVEGVKEVLNYEVDGILFDDYFYPNDEIDIKDYENYIKEHEYISKKEYNLMIINNMVKKVYKECKRKNVKFGISPDGNIENNYEKNMADVGKWLSSAEYVDFIMPQIYYGFYNSTKSYYKTAKEWEKLIKNENIDLYIALAFYKTGREDDYAKDGRYEWINNDNIIMREIILSRNLKNYKGFSLFRYDSIFDKEQLTPNSINEIENLKKILK